MYDNTISDRMQAILSASLLSSPAFSPNALAHNFHIPILHRKKPEHCTQAKL